MHISWTKTCLLAAIAGLALPALAGAQGVEAISKPSRDVKLAFVRSGIIGKIHVQEGQVVKAGQLLIEQDNLAEMAQLEQLKAEAEDTSRVKAAQAQLDQKKVDLAKYEAALRKGASTELEVEHARLDVTIAQLQLQVEQFSRQQDHRKFIEMDLHIKRMQIRSPIEGRVEELMVKQGESADALAKVVRVVAVDPLWVDVPVPMVLCSQIQQSQLEGKICPIQVVFRRLTNAQTQPAAADNVQRVQGKIVFMADVADGASLTRMIRIEVPNPTNRPAGEHVEVHLAEPPAQAVSK